MLDTEQWINSRVGVDNATRLNEITVSEGRRHRWGFIDGLKGWHSHVAKLTSDLELGPNAPGLWGPHDLLAALVFRNALDSGLSDVPPGLLRAASEALDDVDRAYIAYTDPDDCGCVGRVDTDVPSSEGWWWRRVPKRGLIRVELERYYGHPTSAPKRSNGS